MKEIDEILMKQVDDGHTPSVQYVILLRIRYFTVSIMDWQM
jgi:hypothetical protein